MFEDLTSLTSLTLNDNNLSSLEEGVFKDLTELEQLDLDGNNLSSLEEGVFEGLTSLTRLGLVDNRLSTLPRDVFDELTSLTRLDLDGNNLSSLPRGVFDEPTSLNRLNLAHNRLSTLPMSVFDELTKLTWLDLRNNPLACLPSIPSSVTNLFLPNAKPNKDDYSICAEIILPAPPEPQVTSGGQQVTPATAPSAPPKPEATSGDQQVTLSWTAPADNGGSSITGWQYAVKPDDDAYMDWQNVPGSSVSTTTTVTGLTNGTSYQFKVRAVNIVGPGAESPASDVVTPSIGKKKMEEVVLSEPLKQVVAHNVVAVASRLSTISSDALPPPPPAISLDSMVEDGAEFLWSQRKALNSGTPIAWEQVLSGRNFSFPLAGGGSWLKLMLLAMAPTNRSPPWPCGAALTFPLITIRWTGLRWMVTCSPFTLALTCNPFPPWSQAWHWESAALNPITTPMIQRARTT